MYSRSHSAPHGLDGMLAFERGVTMKQVHACHVGARAIVAMALSIIAATTNASAQTSLKISVDAPDEYIPGETTTLDVTISRSDGGNEIPDLVALVASITFPDGWTVVRDPLNNCALSYEEAQGGVPVNPNASAAAVIVGSNATYSDPPTNTVCAPVPRASDNDVLDIVWIVQNDENLTFPITLSFDVATSSGPCSASYTANVNHREGASGEIVGDGGGDVTECSVIVDPVSDGDLNGDGSVDPSDAQLCFDAFLQIPEALAIVVPTATDFCGGSDGADPADAQGIFNAFLQFPNPCE